MFGLYYEIDIKYLIIISNYIFTIIQKSTQIHGLLICHSPDRVGLNYTRTHVKHNLHQPRLSINLGHFGLLI